MSSLAHTCGERDRSSASTPDLEQQDDSLADPLARTRILKNLGMLSAVTGWERVGGVKVFSGLAEVGLTRRRWGEL